MRLALLAYPTASTLPKHLLPEVHVLLGPLLVEPGGDAGFDPHDRRLDLLLVHLAVVLLQLLLIKRVKVYISRILIWMYDFGIDAIIRTHQEV